MPAAVAFSTPSAESRPMTRTNLRSVSIGPDHDKPALSKGQKAFNSLIRQIEKRRKQLRAWETVTPSFQQRYVNELLPLERTSITLQIRMVHLLDQAYVQKGLTKAERWKMEIVIANLAGDLIDEDNEGRELKAIYDKYSPTSFDSQMAAEVNGMKSMLETVFGVDLGDDCDLSSPEELLQRAQAHIQQGQADAA